MDVRRATERDLPRVAIVLARAFRDDPILRWTFPEDDREDRIRRHFAVFDAPAVARGWVWVTDDVSGVAMWVPADEPDGYADLDAAARDATESLTDVCRFDAFWGWSAEHEPAEPYCYLDHLAVDPAVHGRGIGSALLRHGLERADADGVATYLETSSEANVAFYTRRGFAVTHDEHAPGGGPRVWFLVRPPAVRARG